MTRRSHQATNTRKFPVSHASVQGMFQSRPFAGRSDSITELQQKPDLKTSLMQAERYGHYLGKMQPTGISASKAAQPKLVKSPIIQCTKRKRPGNTNTTTAEQNKRQRRNSDFEANQGAKYRSISNRDRGRLTLGNQVNYGPAADLNAREKQELQKHYNNQSGVLERKDQYNKQHRTYMRAAQDTGRPLTKQEAIASNSGKNAPDASINHIIASGTGQNILNHETLRFRQGMNLMQSPDFETNEGRRRINSALANQAAAVGRVQGYNRAIINERQGESLHKNPINQRIYGNSQAGNRLDAGTTRNQALTHTRTAFQEKDPQVRHQAYRDVLKMTYDSPGNLRVGDSHGNNQVSTGVDLPLTQNGTPTGRANRLLDAHTTYAPDRLLTNNRLFTHDAQGNRLSSSSQVPSNSGSTSPKRKQGGKSSPPKRRKR